MGFRHYSFALDASTDADLISAIEESKKKGLNLSQLIRTLLRHYFFGSENDKTMTKIRSEFEKMKKEFEKFIEENFETVKIKNLNVGVLETKNTIPPYIVFEYFKEKDIDFLIIIYRGFKGVKLEFRSIKDIDVHNIAKLFNGGGHFKASGAYIPQNLTKSQILSKIEEIL